MAAKIDLERTFAKKLGMPTTAIKLFQDLNDESEAILDFKGVEFISLSFAQEYIYQKRNCKVHITESNVPEFIKGLLDAVSAEYEASQHT